MSELRTLVIGNENCVLGLGQMGVPGRVAHTTQEVDAALDAALADATIGIVLISADVASLARARVDRLKVNNISPLVVEVPGPDGWLMRTMRDFVQSAVGISLGKTP